jgi:bifunctional DNA-binding transcriptional regulator/antitoxin component of YhaV-PrlF toxin-antitoxin module
MKWDKMSWIVEVDEDGMINFPDELLNQLGWKEGDVVEWVDNHDGSFMLRKYKWECSTQSDAPTTLDQDT